MKPIKIIFISILFILMVVSSLQVLGYISPENAGDSATKAIKVLLILGFFSIVTYFIVRSGSSVSKENKNKKPANSGPDFN